MTSNGLRKQDRNKIFNSNISWEGNKWSKNV